MIKKRYSSVYEMAMYMLRKAHAREDGRAATIRRLLDENKRLKKELGTAVVVLGEYWLYSNPHAHVPTPDMYAAIQARAGTAKSS